MNEYRDSNKYEDCFVAYLDILGFKNKVLESQNDDDTLENIIQSLKIVNSIPSGGKNVSTGSDALRTIQIRSRFFSDSLVFFLKESPEDIAHLFLVIRYLQDRLWERGICLRGSIVRGQMVWTEQDENITVGQGLIDAYQQESTIAIYPRIVVAEKLFRYIENNSPAAYPFADNRLHGTLENYITQDFDGVYFLDLLNHDIIRAKDETLEFYKDPGFSVALGNVSNNRRQEILMIIDRVIADAANISDVKIKQKYAWLKTYRSRYNG